MHSFHSAIAFLAFVSVVPAQSATSPKGYLTTEGNWYHSSLLGYNNAGSGSAICQIDATHRGASRVFKGIALRRDGKLATSATYVGRRVSISIRIAHADLGKVSPNQTNRSTDYVKGSFQNVVTSKVFDLPSLTAKPSSGTAPFNVVFPFDAPFSYNGNDAFALQLFSSTSNLQSSRVPYPIDRIFVSSYRRGAQSKIGTGCTASGRSSPVTHYSGLDNYGPRGLNEWNLQTKLGTATAPVVVIVGAADPNAAFGGCANLRATLDLVLPAGTTDASGRRDFRLKFPHDSAHVGARLYSQCLVFDAAQPRIPFALSHGVRTTYPSDPSFALKMASGGRAWTGRGWPDFRLHYGSGLIIGLRE